MGSTATRAAQSRRACAAARTTSMRARVTRGLGRRVRPLVVAVTLATTGCLVLLLPPQDALAQEEGAWPVESHANGTVVLRGRDGGIMLLPASGHQVKVHGNVKVAGVDILEQLQALTPPKCDGDHEKLLHNGTTWLCECEHGWSGPGCAVEGGALDACDAFGTLFSFDLELETNLFADNSTLVEPPDVHATGLSWQTRGFDVTSVASVNESIATAEWLSGENAVRVNRSVAVATAAAGMTLEVELRFAGTVSGIPGLGECAMGVVVGVKTGPPKVVGEVWTTLQSMTNPTKDLGTASIDGILYAVGGRGQGGGNTIYTLEAFDPSTNQWTARQSMTQDRGEFSAAVIDGILYAVGGYYSHGWPNSGVLNSLEGYNPATNQWTTLAHMSQGRYRHGVAAVDGILYAVGGNGELASLEGYNPATNQWTTLASMSQGRERLAAAAVDGILYAVGGSRYQGSSYPLSTVEAYDPATNQWTTVQGMGHARWSPCAVAMNGKLYVAGGINQPSNVGDKLEVYDPAVNLWTQLPSMSVSRSNFAAAAIGENLYVMGGHVPLPGYSCCLDTLEVT